MIGLPSGTPIYLCTQPVDFRKGFDGLTGIVAAAMNHSVTDGSLFLLVNRRRDRIKALWWETGGLTLWYRRLEQGTVELPKSDDGASHVMIDNVELAMWIAGVGQEQTPANGGLGEPRDGGNRVRHGIRRWVVYLVRLRIGRRAIREWLGLFWQDAGFRMPVLPVRACGRGRFPVGDVR